MVAASHEGLAMSSRGSSRGSSKITGLRAPEPDVDGSSSKCSIGIPYRASRECKSSVLASMQDTSSVISRSGL